MMPAVRFVEDDGRMDPGSVVAALKDLAEAAGERGRSIAVLGPVAVASDDAIEVRDENDRIGRIIVRINISKLIVVGHAGRHLAMAAGLEGSWDGESVLVETPAEAYDLLRADIHEGDVVLVKEPTVAALLTGVTA